MGDNSAGSIFSTLQRPTTFIISQQAHIFPSQTTKQKDSSPALLSYRATPIQATGYSPAQLMLGLQIWTSIPTLEEKLLPLWPDIRAKAAYKHYYNRGDSSRPLPLLKLGEKGSVAVKLDNQEGWTTTTMQHPEILLHFHQWWRSLQKQTAPASADAPHPELEDGEETDIINTAETDSGQQQDNDTTTQTPAVVITSRGRVVKQPSRLKDFLVST